MTAMSPRLPFALLSLAAICLLARVPALAGQPVGVDRNDPTFVTASILVMGPGEELYSHAGHACFRMTCPTFKLDNVFSYEGESASDQIFRFFAGHLKMGMFRAESESFLRLYRASGRGVRQYRLNLTPALKQRLWDELDRQVERGADLPYDYIKRGCAQATLQTLLQALSSVRIDYAAWPERFERSRRELLHSYIADFPWTCLLLHMITGPEGDYAASKVAKVITPDDMIEVLRGATIDGRPILTEAPVELMPQTLHCTTCPVSPMMVAVFLLVLAFVGWVRPVKAVDYALLALQTLLGIAECYIVFVSDLPASGWNWLLIPFNPLPALLWRWRRHWAVPFAVILAGWDVFVLLAPHRLTDPAFYVLAAACAVFFLRLRRRP